MRQTAIAIEGASVRYPGARAEALCDASLTVGAGSRVALIGPNGAGKSTLLKAVVGLLPLARGSVQIFGGPARDARQRVAYVPQRSNVDWSFPISAGDLALMGRDVFIRWPRRPSAADRALAERALDAVGMADLAQRHIADLSGGQQQRVFLARALAQQADLLLLDEPFVGIDTATERVIFGVLDRLRDEGRTVVVATHDLTSLVRHFDRAALIHHTVVASGSPAQVLQPDLLAGAYGGPLALFHGLGAAHQHAECAL
ncbi:metal ABC transporter ATP-binding protein [Chloroflexia bacterium SDU3-3]|nr:metal ABC transporter ATP-binding protein [Chloroflexia bacterium SDU3-3]